MGVTVPRPTGGDVVDLILDDHRVFEELLRQLRDETTDRKAVMRALADVLVAHAEAEEELVYPTLRHKDAIDAEEAEHSEHEHDEGHEALLGVMEVDDPSSEDFGEALHELSETLHHHLDEEERDVLNPARTDVSEEVRAKLGRQFAVRRNELIDQGCGDVEQVRDLVKRAKERGD